MLSAVLGLTLIQTTGIIERSPYGVPKVIAPDADRAFFLFGQAVAEDRLWQMELSRHIARGKISAIQGTAGLASDRNILRRAYTNAELEAQFAALPESVKRSIQAYADGINETIRRRQSEGTLPPGYADAGISPEPWSPIDSCAIQVMLSRQFGAGGAGELRNLALYQYLLGRPVKEQAIDVLNDLSWQNDQGAVPTVDPRDDTIAVRPPKFPNPTRAETEAHLAKLPKTNLFELAPAIQLAMNEPTTRLAASSGVVHKVGSYAIVVSPERSSSGWPLLLTAPQMGHSSPSVIHEVVIDSPNLKVAGISVPGIPSIVIGHTPKLAWGLTSGVADIEDVFVSDLADDKTYRTAGSVKSIQEIAFTIPVQGADPVAYTQQRTVHGPVLLNSMIGKALYSQKMAYWGREVASLAGLFEVYSAASGADLDRALGKIAVTFNFFYATTQGETGYRYVGLVPVRASGIDPRFPTPDRPEYQWQGFLTARQMPHVTRPKSGLITNWNNKPAAWWPNLDTPVWGRIFRNTVLNRALTKDSLNVADLERAAWEIARRDTDTNGYFLPALHKLISSTKGQLSEADRIMLAYDGWDMDGSRGPTLYRETIRQLRRELFLEPLGNFTSESLFVTVLQPTVIANALDGKTKLDYRRGRTVDQVLQTAYQNAVAELTRRLGPPSAWGFAAGSIRIPGQPSVPYGNRGTFIQITELSPVPVARSVAGPGVQEAGPHAQDQVPLLRAWTFKPVAGWNP